MEGESTVQGERAGIRVHLLISKGTKCPGNFQRTLRVTRVTTPTNGKLSLNGPSFIGSVDSVLGTGYISLSC